MAITITPEASRAAAPGTRTHRQLTLAYRLSAALAGVAFVASAAGVALPSIFHDPAMTVGNAQGTSLVILVVALPALVASMVLAMHGSRRALLVWLGAVSYLLYNAVLFSFATAFNRLFLLYVTLFALALWSLVALLIRIDVDTLRARFASSTPVRGIGGYLVGSAVLFLVTWMRQIVPALLADQPAFLDGTIMLTSPVHVLDLSITLPLCMLAGVWLWQRRAWGYVLAGLLLTMLTIETTSIAVDQVWGHLREPAQSLAAVPLFVVLTLVGVVLSVVFLRHIQESPLQRRRARSPL